MLFAREVGTFWVVGKTSFRYFTSAGFILCGGGGGGGGAFLVMGCG